MRRPGAVRDYLDETVGRAVVIEDHGETRHAALRGAAHRPGSLAKALRAAQTTVEQWGVFEVALKGPSEGNPFTDVRLTANFTDGVRTIEATGFYDGNGVYRVRFMPDTPGEWRYETKSNRWPLADKSGLFTVTPATADRFAITSAGRLVHFDRAEPGRLTWAVDLTGLNGETVIALALTEPGAGSDVRGIATTARRDGRSYRVSGRKKFITGTEGAKVGIVMAKSDDGACLFLVDLPDPAIRIERTNDEPAGDTSGENPADGTQGGTADTNVNAAAGGTCTDAEMSVTPVPAATTLRRGAAVAVRLPAVWREWRRPGALAPRPRLLRSRPAACP